MIDWQGKVVTFDLPKGEVKVWVNHVSEEEKQVHGDFFTDVKKKGVTGTKNRERYLKIRNHIIHLW